MTRRTESTAEPLISVKEAERRIASAVVPLPVEVVATAAAAGRVLREPVMATRDQPPFHRATMDGIACTSSDPATALTVTGIGAAGHAPPAFRGPGTCVEIMTGAVVPDGCDVVVPVEQVERHGETVTLSAQANRASGTFVHARGSDHRAGAPLLDAGMRLSATAFAVLVSTGNASVSVSRQPRIAILASGDELIDIGEPARDYQVRRSNDYAAQALLAAHGWRDVARAHVRDDLDEVRAGVDYALKHDVAIMTGGVSKGRYDHLPGVLRDSGVQCVFHRVAQRPGKPMWFGVGPDGQLVFALPGNPVSALTCLRRYVLDALHRLVGLAPASAVPFAELGDATQFAPPLTWLAAACRVPTNDGRRRVRIRRVNTSGDFTGLAGTDGIVELPASDTDFAKGTIVRWFPW